MIHYDRIKTLNDKPLRKGKYILYWMQASQRIECNHALEFSTRQANKSGLPIIVYFELIDDYPEANLRHYAFLLEGLKEVEDGLQKLGIRFVIYHSGNRSCPNLMELSEKASLVVTDRGYIDFQTAWREKFASQLVCPLIQVESDVIVPVETSSDKEEYSAATFRRKITPLLRKYQVPLEKTKPKKSSLSFKLKSFPLKNLNEAISRLKIDKSVSKSGFFKGGTGEAKKHLTHFIRHKLSGFAAFRNDPSKEYLSNLSPYLHFGQISPLHIALEAKKSSSKSLKVFLEELIVRRELAMNFVSYNPAYDRYSCLNDWAKKTLNDHRRDPRTYLYTMAQFENAETHDPFWNAAQREMLITGKMHGYMRMYWGKKILEWTRSPEEGFETALKLNNRYELDGRDPNGFAGVAWCFGKHDRAWSERPVFGKVRYMNDNGLRRKFDIDAYVEKINML